MRSPPHRENLLDASYNVAGFAVIRSGAHLYVVQDFGHSLPAYTPEQSENFIAEAVNRARRAAHLPALTRTSDAVLRAAVCTMAQEDRLATRSMHELAQRYSVVSYTNMHPEVLPAGAAKMMRTAALRTLRSAPATRERILIRAEYTGWGCCSTEPPSRPDGVHFSISEPKLVWFLLSFPVLSHGFRESGGRVKISHGQKNWNDRFVPLDPCGGFGGTCGLDVLQIEQPRSSSLDR